MLQASCMFIRMSFNEAASQTPPEPKTRLFPDFLRFFLGEVGLFSDHFTCRARFVRRLPNKCSGRTTQSFFEWMKVRMPYYEGNALLIFLNVVCHREENADSRWKSNEIPSFWSGQISVLLFQRPKPNMFMISAFSRPVGTLIYGFA